MHGWDGWESRSSQQQVVIRAGRNAGRASLLIAWQMCLFPSGTRVSSSDPSKDFVPWSQVSSKTQILTWCCKWKQVLIQLWPSDKSWHFVLRQVVVDCFSELLRKPSQDFFSCLKSSYPRFLCNFKMNSAFFFFWNRSLHVNSYLVQRASFCYFEAVISFVGRKCGVDQNNLRLRTLGFISELSCLVLKQITCASKLLWKETAMGAEVYLIIFGQLGNPPIKYRRDFTIPVS